ncbi:MAG TPA: hypothetical protein VGM20_07405 [Gemmatimonadales bacterium]|jgi:hypothetical protein
MIRRGIGAAVLAVAMIANRGAAQGAHPDFAGTWVLDASKSTSEPAPLPTSATWTITTHGDTITIDRETTAPTIGTSTSHVVVATDGKPYQNTLPIGPETVTTTSTATFDSQGLVVITTGTSQGYDFTQTDHWTLGTDGKTLTSSRVVDVGGQNVLSATLVFNRKP